MTTSEMIVITGATGLIGRRIVRSLTEAGAKVRAITRDPAGAGLPDAVDVVAGDPSRPASIAHAFDGADAVFLNSRAVGVAGPDLLATARERGVRKAVALAANNIEDDLDQQPSRFRGDYNREAEAAVIGSGLDWVSLRPSMFMTNSIGLWAEPIRGGDVVRMPYPAASWAPIDEDDLAEVAAVALRTDTLLGRRVELTGPASLTQAEMVGIIGSALRRDLRVEQVPRAGAEQHLAGTGLPPAFIRALLDMQERYSAGTAVVSDEVAKILGRPARSFAEWVAANVAAFGAA
jgi:uncharacterized protein YbjT (DUF2867 family)